VVSDLAEDNHYIDQPYGPEDGYHLSKDLADKALGFIRDSKQSEPDKPWYLWFCPGANHAPHHAPRSTSTSTGASSTTGMRPTASGCCPA
jgi:arylsulfatase A-like enzyme